MVASIVDYLGTGCYTIREAAMYGQSDPALLRRWLHETSGAIPRQIPDSEERFVTFLDFVQSLSVRQLRKNYNVPLQRIRKAAQILADNHGVTFPFAREHQLFVYEQDVIYKRPVDGTLIQVSGRHIDQSMMKQVVQPHLKRLRFDSNGLGNTFDVYSRDGVDITMHPKRRFGEPMLANGYTARTLYEAVLAEGSYDQAAEEFEVSRKEVQVAFEWYDALPWRLAFALGAGQT